MGNFPGGWVAGEQGSRGEHRTNVGSAVDVVDLERLNRWSR